MAKRELWRSDWFLGAIVAVVVLVLQGSDLIQSLERKTYGMGVRASQARGAPRHRAADARLRERADSFGVVDLTL